MQILILLTRKALETECVLNLQISEHLCPKYVNCCALLGYYTASSDYLLPKFRDNLSDPSSGFKNPNPEDGTVMLSLNVDKKLPLLPA
jgi:hypothetical protein